jgi:hypothetical protein
LRHVLFEQLDGGQPRLFGLLTLGLRHRHTGTVYRPRMTPPHPYRMSLIEKDL